MGDTATKVVVDLRDALAHLGDMPAASSALESADSSSNTWAVVMDALAGERGVPAADPALLLLVSLALLLRCSAALMPRLLVLFRR